jgi:dTMP kinase
LDLGLIERLNDLAADGLRPHLTLFLDLDPAVGLARASTRLTHPRAHRDRLEGEQLEFHQRVRDGYRAIATQDPGRVVVLDAMQGILEIEAQIRRQFEPLLAAGTRSAGSPAEDG